jgi:hypothetical protein
VAPGRYEADLLVGVPGPYVVTLDVTGEGGAIDGRLVRGFYWSDQREYQLASDARATLAALAKVTGGQEIEGSFSPFQGPREPSYWNASPWLAAAAMLMFLGELLWPADVRGVRAAFRRRPHRAPHETAA